MSYSMLSYHKKIQNRMVWLDDFIKSSNVESIVEAGTGAAAQYAKRMCETLSQNDSKKSKFISYELSEPYSIAAKEILSPYSSFTDLHCGDMFSFFKDYESLQPDLFFLDAGDEKLFNSKWEVEGKDYGPKSRYAAGISENLDFFLEIQNSRSKVGTYVILDDFLYGRGTYILNYAKDNYHDSFSMNWDILDIVKDESGASLCLLRRI